MGVVFINQCCDSEGGFHSQRFCAIRRTKDFLLFCPLNIFPTVAYVRKVSTVT